MPATQLKNPGDPNKFALLIIDVQQGLFTKSTPIYQADSLFQSIHMLVNEAHQSNTLVVYIQHNDEKNLIKHSPGWQLHPKLQPEPQDLHVFKEHGNAFEETNLRELLAAENIGSIVIAGLVTHGCVKNTCLGGLEEGYQVILAGDAHSSFSKDASTLISKWNMQLAQKGVLVRKAAEINFAMTSS